MTKPETIIIALVIGVLSPLLLFVLFWWMAAALAINHILPISESNVAAAAFTGLALGLALDIRYLKKWIPRFYRVDLRLLLLVYLFCSAIAMAFFMGLPFGNLALGTLAGIYIGRRGYHAGYTRDLFQNAAKKAGLFTALVTGLEALPIGLLALRETAVLEILQTVTGLDQSTIKGPPGAVFIVILSASLMGIQFLLSRVAARLAFGNGEEDTT